MFACPHCQDPSISAWRKVGATDTLPAICGRCGGLSFVSGWAHFGGVLVGEVLLWGTAIAALLAKSWLMLLLFPLGLVLWGMLVGSVFPLRPIGRAEVGRARRITALSLGGGVLLLASLSVLGGRW